MLTITRDSLLPWKRTLRIMQEARKREFEIIVAIDTRTKDATRKTVFPYADQIIDYKNTGNFAEGVFNQAFSQAKTPMIFVVSDDEEPSTRLWDFAQNPPQEAVYGIKLVSPRPGKLWYKPGTELQCRLFP